MPWELPSFKLPSHVAGADLTAKQFFAVQVGAAEGQCVLAGAGEHIIGVLQNSPNTGEVAEIMNKGVTKAVSGAAVTLGAEVEIDANGKFIDFSAGITVGIALEGTVGADDRLTVLLY